MKDAEMKDALHVLRLLLEISIILARTLFPMTPMARLYYKHKGLHRWREVRAIYAKYGIELRVP